MKKGEEKILPRFKDAITNDVQDISRRMHIKDINVMR